MEVTLYKGNQITLKLPKSYLLQKSENPHEYLLSEYFRRSGYQDYLFPDTHQILKILPVGRYLIRTHVTPSQCINV